MLTNAWRKYAERVAQREAGRTEDFKGAVFAFLQKRQPTFQGR